ncbi:MAG: inorganic phosphate transporter [Bacteroidetes bacterium]|nr:MAG: inorganic phosphate transporter [Bacteroidota bacterium]
MIFFFLSSGLFLGWSLGANDAANVFGSAVGTKMVSFKKAAIIAGIFVIIGAVVQGAGGAHTLGSLGKIDALAGSFTVALSAAITVFYMTKFKLPVSTTQAIVGGIIGWNFYTGNPTNINSLTKILTTWVAGPILGAIFAVILYQLFKFILKRRKPHLLKLDAFLRFALLVVGAFGSYSLGANNIANVMGIFVSAAPTTDLDFVLFTLSGIQQLFLIGGIAIAIGIFTYSKRIMKRVGNSIVQLSSEAALVVVLSHSIVLFIFSSQALSDFVASIGLPAIPLVPVSSSQVIVGSIIGIGLLKGGRGIKFGVLGQISIGWVTTPILAGLLAFFALFFINNVFKLKVTQDSELINPFTKSHSEIDSNNSYKIEQDTSVLTNAFNIDSQFISETENVTESTINDSLQLGLNLQIIDSTEISSLESTNKISETNSSFWKKATFILLALIILLIIWYLFSGSRFDENKNREIVKKREEFQKAEQELIESELKNVNLKKQHLQNELKFKNRELVNFALHVIQKDSVFQRLKDKIDKIKNETDSDNRKQLIKDISTFVNQNLNTDKDKETFNIHVEEESREFYTRLNQLHSGITPNERRLCALVRLNFSSKEIASILNISPKSVEMNRYRLRKKLNVPSSQNLNDYISKI